MFKRPSVALISLLAFAAPVAAQDFPVTIEHVYGTTTIEERPQRVVSIGLHEQDFLYALGVAPIGVKEWFGEKPYATWPWAEDERAALGAEPEVMTGDGINFEWVLAQDPDLIVGIYWWLEQEDYDRLSEIAPVVASPAGYDVWAAPWQAELAIIDQATSSNTEKSDAIVAEFDARYAEVRSAYPELEGMTGTNIYLEDDGNFTAWGPNDLASKFLVDLGLVFPPQLEGLAAEDNRITISAENIDLLEMDVAVWPVAEGSDVQAVVEALPTYQSLAIAREGRSVWLDDGDGLAYAAMSWQTPLSLGYLLDILPAQLAAAADGDPETQAE
ncbi:ABC transporter substrate-binding protein [Pelagibacterium sp. H642]|uniref:ABC transporter substrate-binding protein n=1 Tax=Pelagibacterium sp. H642 TaxID=1881069 RepID=UPI00281593B1|nr:ABC transporter substrate-binding protein [Pelagibacterium sp. H642]WMT89474.1 ABC transporter substrate-binding protein [Pelagibacterium sp. H642]